MLTSEGYPDERESNHHLPCSTPAYPDPPPTPGTELAAGEASRSAPGHARVHHAVGNRPPPHGSRQTARDRRSLTTRCVPTLCQGVSRVSPAFLCQPFWPQRCPQTHLR